MDEKLNILEYKDQTTMSIDELNDELDAIDKMERKLIDFKVLGRCEDLVYELRYRKIYEPKGYSRFQAGCLMG